MALSLVVVFLYTVMGLLDLARGRIMARVGTRFQGRLDRRVFDAMLRRSAVTQDPLAAGAATKTGADGHLGACLGHCLWTCGPCPAVSNTARRSGFISDPARPTTCDCRAYRTDPYRPNIPRPRGRPAVFGTGSAQDAGTLWYRDHYFSRCLSRPKGSRALLPRRNCPARWRIRAASPRSYAYSRNAG